MSKLEITFVFTAPLLGTAPGDKNIYSTFIANGHQEETETLPGEDKGKTVFHRDADGKPCLYDYVLKGFFKDACSMQARFDVSLSKNLKAYKKVIDGLVHVFPRLIPIELPKGGALSDLERPLRAQTAQGERVALACSEMAPEGSSINFTVEVLNSTLVTKDLLKEWMNYGRYRGLGQWRSASWGRFRYSIDALSSDWK